MRVEFQLGGEPHVEEIKVDTPDPNNPKEGGLMEDVIVLGSIVITIIVIRYLFK